MQPRGAGGTSSPCEINSFLPGWGGLPPRFGNARRFCGAAAPSRPGEAVVTGLLAPPVAASAPARSSAGPGTGWRPALLTAGAVWSVLTVAHLAVQMLAR